MTDQDSRTYGSPVQLTPLQRKLEEQAAEIDRLKDMIIHDHARMRLENEQLRADRAELVETLDNLMRRLDGHFGGSYDWKEQEDARAVLAKHRGEGRHE